jgi:hypothetical protein
VVQQCAARNAVVLGSTRSSVRQCGSEAVCAAVRQCTAVRVAVCGSALDDVCLFVFDYIVCVFVYCLCLYILNFD